MSSVRTITYQMLKDQIDRLEALNTLYLSTDTLEDWVPENYSGPVQFSDGGQKVWFPDPTGLLCGVTLKLCDDMPYGLIFYGGKVIRILPEKPRPEKLCSCGRPGKYWNCNLDPWVCATCAGDPPEVSDAQ